MIATIHEARTRLLEQEKSYTRRRMSVSEIQVDSGHIGTSSERFRLTDESLGRLCRQLGAPSAYISTLDTDIQSTLLQYHLGRGKLRDAAVTLVAKGEELVAVETGSLHRLQSSAVLDAVQDGIGNHDLKVHQMQVSSESFYLELVSDIASEEVARGDYIKGGLRISHSMIGQEATVVEAFVLRLVCLNGLTHRDCIAKGAARTRRLPANRPDANDLQTAQIRRLAADAMQSLRTKLEAIKGLQDEPVEFEHMVRRWIERARLSTRRLLPLIRDAWQREGGRSTAYDAMNALTNVATHAPDLDFRSRRVLTSLAGIFAFRKIHFCPRCFSLLGSSPASSVAS